MANSITDLCSTFRERAEWTNDIIRSGYATRLGILEESITDYHLLEFARRHEAYVSTRKFSRREEGSLSGADWLWCVGGPEGWLLLLVQAKIVNPMSGTCLHLNYKKGHQRQQLVRYAKALGAVPMYCVYSYLSGDFMPSSTRVANPSSIPLAQWACTFVTPREIRRLTMKRLRKQSDVLNVGLPWAIPFCRSGANAQKGLADTAAEGFVAAKHNAEAVEQGALVVAEKRHPTLSKRPRFSWEDADATAIVTRHFPKAVAQLFSGYNLRSQQARLFPATVSILSTEPIRDELARVEKLQDSRSKYRALRSLFSEREP
jgi:hypothetical protein